MDLKQQSKEAPHRTIDKHFREVIINTGNLLLVEELKRKPQIVPVDELAEGVRLTLDAYRDGKIEPHQVGRERIILLNPKYNYLKPENIHRNLIKVTAKLFLYSLNDLDAVDDSVDQLLKALNINTIDSLIIAPPPKLTFGHATRLHRHQNSETFEDQALTYKDFELIWAQAEALKKKERVLSLGVADFNTEQLKELSERSTYKPASNQINLDACCVIPPEMSAYAKENNIQLLTHNDPRDFFVSEQVENILEPYVEKAGNWDRHWIMRYSVMIKDRGILQTKGYLMSVMNHSNCHVKF